MRKFIFLWVVILSLGLTTQVQNSSPGNRNFP
jgi:hypothetical protein